MDLERLLQFVRRRRNPLLALGLMAASAFLLWTLLPVLSPFLVAFVMAYVLAPLVRGMRKVKIGRRRPQQMTCVLVLYIVLFGAVLVIGLPLLVNVAGGLARFASGVEKVDLQVETLQGLRRYEAQLMELPMPAEARTRLEAFFSDPTEVAKIVVTGLRKTQEVLSGGLRRGAGILTSAVSTGVSAGVHLMLVPVLLFYFLLEYEALYPAFMHAVPVPYRSWMERFLLKVDRSLGGFVRGQLLIAFLFGVVMTLGLWLIGVQYAVVLGPVSGLANMVPYLGVVVGLVPAFFLALWQGGLSMSTVWMCGAILLLFVFLQTLDGYVFQPRILGPSVELHPLWIMLALAVGEHLMGLPGMMLAVPVAAVLRVFLEETYPLVYDTPEDAPDDPDGATEAQPEDRDGAAGDEDS